MELLPFLTSLTSPRSLDPYNMVILQAKEPAPLLFNTALRARIAALGSKIDMLDPAELDFALFRSTLETSFLGMSTRYWLYTAELDERKQRQVLTYLGSYQGPHTIVVCVDEEHVELVSSAQKSLCIVLPPHVTEKMFIELAQFLYPAHISKNFAQFAQAIFKRRLSIALDTACLLMQYGVVLGAATPQFVAQWLDKIVVADKSLFTLSQHFFARDTHRFFTLWRTLKDDYPEVFWLTYWSEQLWRACIVVNLQRENNIVEAKKMSFRLPFSFMQKDWRNYSGGELKNAHHFVYDLDYRLKNGSICPMELLYAKFFLGDFKQTTL